MPDPTTPEEDFADALLREVISHFDYDSWKELEEEGWNHLVGERRAIQAALLRAEARVLREYGAHKEGCAVGPPYAGPCDCGFRGRLEEADRLERKTQEETYE